MCFTIKMYLTIWGIFNAWCFINIGDIANLTNIESNFTSFLLYLVYIKHLVYILFTSTKKTLQCFPTSNWHWFYIVRLLACLHRRQCWHRSAGRNRTDIELYPVHLANIAMLVNIERYYVYIVPFQSCLYRRHCNVGQHRVYTESKSYPYYFAFIVDIAMFGDIESTLRLEHTFSILFLHRRHCNIGQHRVDIVSTLCPFYIVYILTYVLTLFLTLI